MSITLQEYCLQHNRQDLLEQWHSEKNGDLTPDLVSSGSHKKVWWKCKKGHESQAEIKARVRGDKCPYCTRRVVSSNENDLATTHPALAAEWHPSKNGTLTPDQVLSGAKRAVWWKCKKGHEWQAMIYSRTFAGSGCPICSNRKILPGENDLATFFPDIALQWNQERNGTLKPDAVSPYSNKKVWWRCDKGHEYNAEIADRTSANTDCPYCAGRKVLKGFNDLQTKEPLIAAQWHSTLNGELTPDQVTCGSNKVVWWQCADGHVWKTPVYSRGCKKYGCPVCSGNVKPRRPV